MHLYLRHATANDVALLQNWESKPHVTAATNTKAFFEDWASAIKDAPVWRELFIAINDTRPIGFIQVINPGLEPTAYWADTDQLIPDQWQRSPATQALRAIDIWIGEESD